MYLAEGQTASNEVNEMNEQKDYAYALITVIAEKGCSDMVMDAARAAGAGGGTVVHAKGHGNRIYRQIFRRFDCRGKRNDLYRYTPGG